MLSLLNVGIRIRVEALFELDLVGQFILTNHIDCEQVDNSLLPADRPVRIDESDAVFSVILNFAHGTSMGHKPLPGYVSRGVNLQKYEIPFALGEDLLKSIKLGKTLIVLSFGHADEFDLIGNQLLALIGLFERIEGFYMRLPGES
jgi:hypothetical protein